MLTDANGNERKGIEVSVNPAHVERIRYREVTDADVGFVVYREGCVVLHFYSTVRDLMLAGF